MQPNSFFKTLNSIYSNLNSDPIHSFGGLLWSAVSEYFEVGDIEETRGFAFAVSGSKRQYFSLGCFKGLFSFLVIFPSKPGDVL